MSHKVTLSWAEWSELTNGGTWPYSFRVEPRLTELGFNVKNKYILQRTLNGDICVSQEDVDVLEISDRIKQLEEDLAYKTKECNDLREVLEKVMGEVAEAGQEIGEVVDGTYF